MCLEDSAPEATPTDEKSLTTSNPNPEGTKRAFRDSFFEKFPFWKVALRAWRALNALTPFEKFLPLRWDLLTLGHNEIFSENPWPSDDEGEIQIGRPGFTLGESGKRREGISTLRLRLSPISTFRLRLSPIKSLFFLSLLTFRTFKISGLL